jgi:hypothetical protein
MQRPKNDWTGWSVTATRGTGSCGGAPRLESRSRPGRGRIRRRTGRETGSGTDARTGDGFLDSSTAIEDLRNGATVTAHLDERDPWWSSTVRVFEVLNGPTSDPDLDPVEERHEFGGVRAREVDERLAIEASRSRHAVVGDGTEPSPRDATTAATARSTADRIRCRRR